MASRKGTQEEPIQPRRRPATTPEGRENQLVALATDVAEKQLRAGTASAAVIVHYLKLGTTREQLEQARLVSENSLLRAKAEQLDSAKSMESLYEDAIKAMKSYSGHDDQSGDHAYED